METATLNFKDLPIPELKDEDLTFISKWIGNRLSSKEDIVNHIKEVHNEVLASEHVYRCISEMQYLTPRISYFSPDSYQKVLELSKSFGKSFRIIDIGACFGQETRGLIMDGIPAECVVATDIHDYYWKMGKKLFMDDQIHDSPSTHSVTNVETIFGDFTTELTGDESNDISAHMQEKFHVILCFAIFHCLSKEQSERMITRLFHILKPGGMLFGYAAGSTIAAREWGRTPTNTATRWLYSCDSLEEIFKLKGFQNVSVRLRDRDLKILPSNIESDIGLMEFTVTK